MGAFESSEHLLQTTDNSSSLSHFITFPNPCDSCLSLYHAIYSSFQKRNELLPYVSTLPGKGVYFEGPSIDSGV